MNVLLAGRELVSFLVHRALDDVPEASHRIFFVARIFRRVCRRNVLVSAKVIDINFLLFMSSIWGRGGGAVYIGFQKGLIILNALSQALVSLPRLREPLNVAISRVLAVTSLGKAG